MEIKFFSSVKRTIAAPSVTFVQGVTENFILILDQSAQMAVDVSPGKVINIKTKLKLTTKINQIKSQ
jgi:hypothetical protein